MEIRQIKHFMAVVETGSFTKGSERAAISQPALSASIAKLEDELGVKLLDRQRSQVVPTFAGARLLERAQSLLVLYNAMKSEVRGAVSSEPLKIGVLQTLASPAIGRLIADFRRTCPGYAVEVFEADGDELDRRAADKRLDAIFSIAPDDGACRLHVRPLFEEQLVLALATAHPLVTKDVVTLGDLHGQPLIERCGCPGYAAIAKAMAEQGIAAHIVYRTGLDDRALQLVADGLGITVVPELYAYSGTVRRIIADFEYSRVIALQWVADRPHQHLGDFVVAAGAHGWALGEAY